MKKFEYYLLPESGYVGQYERREGHYLIKKGTVADMIHDSGMLWGYDFDKVIPDFEKMNEILLSGEYPRLVEWEPFTINEKEYEEMVQKLLIFPLDKPYRIEQGRVLSKHNLEYIKLFMKYESNDMPVVYFYEIDLDNERLALRVIEVFNDRHLQTITDIYQDVIEVVSIPTIDEFNTQIWGDGFYALNILKEEFEDIWEKGIYEGDLSV